LREHAARLRATAAHAAARKRNRDKFMLVEAFRRVS
jgi:hypothetical protein